MKDEVICVYDSGQKEVTKVKNSDFGICIRKIKKNSVKSRRIIQEIDIQKSLNSRYYPKVFFSDYSNNTIIVYEEFIEGNVLSKIIDEDNYFKNNEEKCLSFLKSLLLGLNIIWDKDIVHRDLKPANIIVRDNGEPVILDLGLAKILTNTANSTSVWLTHGYAAPEQILGSRIFHKRTDFFSLGTIIYEMYFGVRLFADDRETVYKKPDYNYNNMKPSPQFVKILNGMLEKEMAHRYRKTSNIIEDINIALKECEVNE